MKKFLKSSTQVLVLLAAFEDNPKPKKEAIKALVLRYSLMFSIFSVWLLHHTACYYFVMKDGIVSE